MTNDLDEPKTILRIGRASANDVVVDNLLVNRFHAELRLDEDGRWILVDLDSRNGTFLNQNPIRTDVVRPGDLISITPSIGFRFLDGGHLEKVQQNDTRDGEPS